MKNAKRSWITTLFGLLTLAAAIAPIWAPEKYAAKIQSTAALLAGSGLVAAKDAGQSGPPDQ